MTSGIGRRQMVRLASGLVAVGGIAPLIAPSLAIAGDKAKQEEKMEEVTPPEDLMREHGVLNRLLLIYEAAMQKFASNESFDPSILTKSAQIIRDFIENYHEINEENHLFPRFRKAGKLIQLVDVLFQQHLAGRRVTDTILRLAPASAAAGEERAQTIAAMQAFIRMYRPHEAREDTVLFPALRSVVTANEFDAMGEDFEKDEQRKFGQDGFEKAVTQVASLEEAIGIGDLAKFTPAG